MKAFHKAAALFLTLTALSPAWAQPSRGCQILLAGQSVALSPELAMAIQDLAIESQEDLVAIENSAQQVSAALQEIEAFKAHLSWVERHFSERWIRLWGGDTSKIETLRKLEAWLESRQTLHEINVNGAHYTKFWVDTLIENWLRSQSQRWVQIRQLERGLQKAICLADACEKEAARIDSHIGFAAGNFQWRLRGRAARRMFNAYQNRSPMQDVKNLMPNLLELNRQMEVLGVEWSALQPRDLKWMAKRLTLTETAENVILIRDEVRALKARLLAEQKEVDDFIAKTICETRAACLKF